ncbi:DUF4129 domain-containing protein [Thiocapsa marina]|uniref:Protein-glutamine gamma-glutamyltransferase-like C-terminal domain-containing protein n=1 Tax=Thiocapsa marina 5811 TaxID=768671 RepID=F9U8Q0_9GAMM|nr:DUF4129 domain-containing protein [Thiocapsa marina]EGV19158.1 hypothetical protein ThimaDRAFT_1302 [Thiocapsa marina 5811]
MRIDAIGARLRPRRPWEGVDLGFALGREWFVSLWILWWVTALPIAALLAVLTGGRPDLWLVAVWWCKPLYEAPLQSWAGRALLRERPERAELVGIVRAALTRHILPLLLWRRPGLRRSFLMPVTLLEGLTGAPARRRRAVLSDGIGAPTWLTLVCYHFEAILWGGVLLGLVFLVPEELPRLDLTAAVTESDSPVYWISAAIYLLAFSVIAPFYVCAGFGLYLTRRTELEAWDLELAFRRARDEQDAAAREARSPTSGALSAVAILSFPSTSADASTPQDPALDASVDAALDPGEAQVLIREILADEDFGGTQEITLWLPVEPDPTEPVAGWTWSIDLGGFAVALAEILKWSLLVLAFAVLVWLALKIIQGMAQTRSRSRSSRPGSRGESDRPPRLLEDLGTEPLPEDLPEMIRRLTDKGEHRAALALLYRASLAELARGGVAIPAGATEGDVLAMAAKTLPAPRVGLMARLTGHWSRVAYAHRPPSGAELIALLDDWCRARDLPTGPTREPRSAHDV